MSVMAGTAVMPRRTATTCRLCNGRLDRGCCTNCTPSYVYPEGSGKAAGKTRVTATHRLG